MKHQARPWTDVEREAAVREVAGTVAVLAAGVAFLVALLAAAG